MWLISLLICFFCLTSPVAAIEDPLAVPNNRFGIHLIDETDIDLAADLVNTNGGDWGYVTLVIRENDRDLEKWQRLFDHLRRVHLIPIIRLATALENEAWRAPKPEDAEAWADFLNRLNWVVANRYVVLFNEPNHAKEWGGAVKPAEFAMVVQAFHQALKQRSADFFILPGAVDSASPDGAETMSATQFYKFMQAAVPKVFQLYDGLASHAYPHPDFIGRPSASGPGTVAAFIWEQNFLKTFGLKSNLPVFITETGWTHNQTAPAHYPALKTETVAEYLTQAYANIWNSPSVVAVTPFVLKYLAPPFIQFSWVDDQNRPLPQYLAIQALSKEAGQPSQRLLVDLNPSQIPLKLVTDSIYSLPLTLSNLGQSIFSPQTDQLVITSPLVTTGQLSLPLSETEPGQPTTSQFSLVTPQTTGLYPFNYQWLHQPNQVVSAASLTILVVNPPSLEVQAKLFLKLQATSADFTLKVYDDSHLVKQLYPFTVINGQGFLPRLTNIIPNRLYRFRLEKAYYLPIEQLTTLNDTHTTVNFGRLLPFDPQVDGQFNYQDILAAIKQPLPFLARLTP